MLKTVPAVRGLADPLTNAMVDVYLASQVSTKIISYAVDLALALPFVL